MLRLTDLKLPLDHADGDIEAAVLKRLRIAPQELRGYSVFRRAVDARKRSAIALIYALDIDVENEAAVLARCKGEAHLSPAPDLSYRFVAQAPAAQRFTAGRHRHRPLRPVRGTDPGADGLSPDPAGARQGGARAHQGYLGPVAQVGAEPGIQCAIRRRRRRHVFRRQAAQPDQGPASLRPQGADGIRQGRRAAGNPLSRQAACRHLPAGDGGGKYPPHHRGARRRISLSAAKPSTSRSTNGRTAAAGSPG